MKMEEKWTSTTCYGQHPSLKKLTPLEKKYLLAVEHGDADTVIRILEMKSKQTHLLDVNCMDPVGRTATLMTIDNENLEMLKMLLEYGVKSKDSLLHAVNAEYVEAVDLLLQHEESVHKEGDPHSWELVDRDISTFTPEISPLILAAHKDNYEILKLLLDRGATLPMPHDVRCKCNDCVQAIEEDCLFHSRSRINAYRALSSPSLICLSSIDPILTAFELSWELRRLSFIENEFKNDYQKLRLRCQDFATSLLDHARSSRELEVVLNHDPSRLSYQHGDHMPLTRVEMAIKYKQKKFVAHPNVQQLLSTLWYDGLPGFRKQNAVFQLWDIVKIGVLFPYYSWIYMLMPNSPTGHLIRKPFFKFILHSFSYLFFLFLLILASQRVETLVVQLLGTERMKLELMESMKMQRGQMPSIIETSILLYIIAHIWQETRELWKKGLFVYFQNMWNIIDLVRNSLYVGTAGLRVLAYFQAQAEIRANPMAAYIPRESWNAFDPTLIADGLFAAGNVFAALKLIHIFSINPYLGPLQISLGRMVIDIIKFFFIYTLVLFAFACGLNQLLWYYADLEKQECYSGSGGTENWEQARDSCLAWRRFSNLFESSQSLFWASFGLIDIGNFELTGIKSYTRFWGLLMFGSYSVINVVVLLNLLIAMMSNSYQMISERSDVEWKFARTALFMNYFEEGDTVPPPFNIFPTVKNLMRMLQKKKPMRDASIKRKESKMKERDSVYQSVMCNLVWRYVTAQQKACEDNAVTEDHINELRQDVSAFRHELMGVLQTNGMNTSDVELDKTEVSGKKIQVRKRRLIKDFSIGLMEVCTEDAAPEVKGNKGGMLARLGLSSSEGSSVQRWRDLIQAVKKSNIKRNADNESEPSRNGKHPLQKQNSIEDIDTTDEQEHLPPDNLQESQSLPTKTFTENHREVGDQIRDTCNGAISQNSVQKSNCQESPSLVVHRPRSPCSNAVTNDSSTSLPKNASDKDFAIDSPISDDEMEKANILPDIHRSEVYEDAIQNTSSSVPFVKVNSSPSTTSNRISDTHILRSYSLEKKRPGSHSPLSSRSLQKFLLDDTNKSDGSSSHEDISLDLNTSPAKELFYAAPATPSKTSDATSLEVNDENSTTDHTVTMVIEPQVDQCLGIELPLLSESDTSGNFPNGETTINVPSSGETSPVKICPSVTLGSTEIIYDGSQSEEFYAHNPEASNHELSLHPSISITVIENVEDETKERLSTEDTQSDVAVTTVADHGDDNFSCVASVLSSSDSANPVSSSLIVMQMPQSDPEAQFRFTNPPITDNQQEDIEDACTNAHADAPLSDSDQQLLLCDAKLEGITIQRHRKGWI